MDAAARLRRLKREARYLLWGWTVLVCVVGTVGGIIGWVEIDNDRT